MCTLTLIIKGVGYRANIQGKEIILNLGFSHPVTISIPENINVEIIQNTKIILKSYNFLSLVYFGEEILSWRPSEICATSFHN